MSTLFISTYSLYDNGNLEIAKWFLDKIRQAYSTYSDKKECEYEGV